MSHTPTASAIVRGYLAAHVRRRRLVGAVKSVSHGVASVLLWLLIVAIVDRVWPLPGVMRMVLLASLLTLIAIVVIRVIQRLRRPPDWIAAAVDVERDCPALSDRLSTVVSQAEFAVDHRDSAALTAAVEREVAAVLAMKVLSQRHDFSRLQWPLARLALLSIVIGLLASWPWLGLPALVVRQVLPWSERGPVTVTRIDVLTRDVRVTGGDTVQIVADITRPLGTAEVLWLPAGSASAEPAEMTRDAVTGRFVFAIKAVADATYRVRCGDSVSRAYAVTVVPRPPATLPAMPDRQRFAVEESMRLFRQALERAGRQKD